VGKLGGRGCKKNLTDNVSSLFLHHKECIVDVEEEQLFVKAAFILSVIPVSCDKHFDVTTNTNSLDEPGGKCYPCKEFILKH